MGQTGPLFYPGVYFLYNNPEIKHLSRRPSPFSALLFKLTKDFCLHCFHNLLGNLVTLLHTCFYCFYAHNAKDKHLSCRPSPPLPIKQKQYIYIFFVLFFSIIFSFSKSSGPPYASLPSLFNHFLCIYIDIQTTVRYISPASLHHSPS